MNAEPTRTVPPKLPLLWWVANRNYLIFMLRELSAVFLALFMVEFLGLLRQVPKGPEAVSVALAKLSRPHVVVFNLVALAFSLLHTWTWFQAAAVILPLKVAGRPVPGPAIIGGNLAGAAGLVVFVWWAVTR